MKLKILTLNLWQGGWLFDSITNFLQQQADIMLFQEAYDGHQSSLEKRFRTIELLTELFPQLDHRFGPVFLDQRGTEGEIEWGQLILSRFPLQQHRLIHFDSPYATYNHNQVADFMQFSVLSHTR